MNQKKWDFETSEMTLLIGNSENKTLRIPLNPVQSRAIVFILGLEIVEYKNNEYDVGFYDDVDILKQILPTWAEMNFQNSVFKEVAK